VSEGKGAEVFVVVLNWNGRDVIEACLESLRKVKEPAIEVRGTGRGQCLDRRVERARAQQVS